MKILVVFTGGTIGSTVNGGYIAPDESKSYTLIEMYRESQGREADFDFAEPYTLLSENLTGEHINLLGHCVLSNITKNYDGIIVTHGTDTLPYTAASLSYLVGIKSIPVVLVSSNYVLDDSRSNGLANFSGAVDFIAQNAGKGAFVSYKNSDGVLYVHRASRLLQHLPYSDDVYSVGGQYYGVLDGGRFEKNESYQTIEDAGMELKTLPDSWDSKILRVWSYPGMKYPDVDSNVKAVLHDTYHSGTICSALPQLKDFMEKTKEKNVPVFLSGAETGMDYESTRVFEKLGILHLPKASPVAMYMKLWMSACDTERIEDIVYKSIGEDIIG